MGATEQRAPTRPRPGLTAFRPTRRRPELTDKAACAVFLVAVAVFVGVSTGRAEEVEERYSPSSRSPRQAVQELAEQHFAPEWVGWAVRVARCESSWNLYAESSGWDRRYGWYRHVGPWQVSVPTWGATAWELFGGPLTDPDVGAAMAAYILEHQGPGAWPVCRWAR